MGHFLFMTTPSQKDRLELKPNLLPYPQHVAAPVIVPTDITGFKRVGLEKVNKVFDKRYKEILKEAETLQESFSISQEVYESTYKFEPIVGEIYHLYEQNNGTKFLSIIGPTEWNGNYQYSVMLNSNLKWTKL